MTLRLTPVLALSAAALTLALSLSGCGSDDTSSSDAGSAAQSPSAASDAGAPADAEDVDALDEGFDDALANPSLDIIATSIKTVFTDVTDYRIDGDAMTFQVDASKEGSSKCVIATSVISSFDVPEDATITFEYTDGSETCER
ncbi:hypothetical protein BH11ACT8_BH11ACT8_15290 [soil metagenome]